MSTASQGRTREHKVRDDLNERGYPPIMRAAASKGPADLLHGHPFIGAVLIQVGTGNKTLGPDDRNRFVAAADMCGAMPILATVVANPGKATTITYWHVTRDVASTWRRWLP